MDDDIKILEKSVIDINEMNNIIKKIIDENKINEIENINDNNSKKIEIGTNQLILSYDSTNKYRIKKLYGYLILIITFPFMIHKLFR